MSATLRDLDTFRKGHAVSTNMVDAMLLQAEADGKEGEFVIVLNSEVASIIKAGESPLQGPDKTSSLDETLRRITTAMNMDGGLACCHMFVCPHSLLLLLIGSPEKSNRSLELFDSTLQDSVVMRGRNIFTDYAKR